MEEIFSKIVMLGAIMLGVGFAMTVWGAMSEPEDLKKRFRSIYIALIGGIIAVLFGIVPRLFELFQG